MFKNITRTTGFWSVFTAVSLVSAFFGAKYFFKVTPMLSLNMQMNRDQALQDASQLSQSHDWQPSKFDSATAFQHDGLVQFFAELECGGVETFKTMIKEKLYQPYKWHVRHFKEQVTQENHVFFTPEGHPYGFELKFADTDNPGNLSVSEARALALKLAQKDWNISFDDYKEIEVSKDEKPSGRLDHTFLYERTNKKLGEEGKYRIRLVVSGNKFSQLTQFVHVPESFIRRYTEMRSKNNMFVSGFWMIFRILYLILGCLIGGFILIRKRRYLAVPTLIAVGTLAILSILTTLNSLPLMWMGYNTATSSTSFIATAIMSGIFGALMNGVTFLLVIGAAEGFDRWAFPNHIQFWKSWGKKVGGSLNILGQTLGGYGLFCFELLLMTVTYYILSRWFGWWMPTGTLIDPNILATHVPWFNSFVPSLTAGFWEEFANRALPIAGALVLGRYLGREKLFLAIAFIGQAIIFGGLHTFYAQQPVYFRIVELFIPSLIWGAAYLLFGLLPGIICHYIWDLMWFSFPIMASNAPGMLFQKFMILLVGFAPLLVVFYRRFQVGAWKYVSDSDRNEGWKVPAIVTHAKETIKSAVITLSANTQNIVLGLGIFGLASCFVFGQLKNTNPPLNISKTQAIESAQKALHTLPNTEKKWTILSQAAAREIVAPSCSAAGCKPNPSQHAHSFIWRTQKDLYSTLLGTYLPSAHWQIRFASFEGDLIERTEEYRVFVNTDGNVYRISHTLPEQTKGSSLSQGEARGIALAGAKHFFNLGPNELKEISAFDIERPHRKDWTFTFQDTSRELKEDGQARVSIIIGGKTVIDYERFVFVPETWARTETNRLSFLGSFSMICLLFILLLSLLAAGTAGHLIFAHFNMKNFLFFFGIFTSVSCIYIYNAFPAWNFNFLTAQPFSSQIFSMVATMLSGALLQGFLSAVLAGHVFIFVKGTRYRKTTLLPVVGMALVGGLCGIVTLVGKFLPTLNPQIADISTLNSYLPTLNVTLWLLSPFIKVTALFVLLARFVNTFTNNWKKRTVLGAALIICSGIVTALMMGGAQSIVGTFVIGIPLGIGLLLTHYYIISNDLSLVVPATAGLFIFTALHTGLMNGYPGAFMSSIIGIIVIAGFGFLWFTRIASHES
jgi:hypothetical protein